MRRRLVLTGFVGIMLLLAGIVIVTAENMEQEAPKYQANLTALIEHTAAALKLEKVPDWESIRAATLDKLDLEFLLGMVLGSVGSLLGIAAIVAIYAAFLLGERGGFARKMAVAFPRGSAERTRRVIADVNSKIGTYLSTKTLINAILGIVSWAVLWWFGVDFAVFWALLIALLHYIPYVGSFLGVLLPVVLSLAQFSTAHYRLAGFMFICRAILCR